MNTLEELAKLPMYANHFCGKCKMQMVLINQTMHNPPLVKMEEFQDRMHKWTAKVSIHSTETYKCPECQREYSESRQYEN